MEEIDDTSLSTVKTKTKMEKIFVGSSEVKYTIHECSSYSPEYPPENILVHKPKDTYSRWSSESNQPPQYIILKLVEPAIVTIISFGKYERNHVCNMRKFKVFGGVTENSFIELLDSGLKNDSQTEFFNLKYSAGGGKFACKFIKIVPIMSWGPSFNFSIWHVKLYGNCSLQVVPAALSWFNLYREQEAVRLCLKHFRQHNYTDAFAALQARTHVQLEDPLLTRLHTCLVLEGDYKATEELFIQAADDGCLDGYVNKQEKVLKWIPLISEDNIFNAPCSRGGHQMCIDPQTETLYLFGGWNGAADLNDLWSYHIPSKRWICLSVDTSDEGGPSPRSCHKMVLDTERKKIFTMGHYVEGKLRKNMVLKSDFYMYDIESNAWTQISEDTSQMGGPKLMFDHQMCMDIAANTIYVFGGRVLTNGEARQQIHGAGADEAGAQPAPHFESEYGGLFSFHVPTNAWCQIDSLQDHIEYRAGHSMLFHEKRRLLYIFSGQRTKKNLTDFHTFDVDTQEIQTICCGKYSELPFGGFTQRATIDAELNKIHVLSGSNKDHLDSNVRNCFFIYDISKNDWCKIHPKRTKKDLMSDSKEMESDQEPCPRYAHQFIYDPVKQTHYLFGGNPGKSAAPRERLGDFWALRFERAGGRQDVTRRCVHMVRAQRFRELAAHGDKMAAMRFLQTELHDTVNPSCPQETLEFQRLSFELFNETKKDDGFDMSDESHRLRSELFNKLVEYFPDKMTQPKANLVDLLQL